MLHERVKFTTTTVRQDHHHRHHNLWEEIQETSTRVAPKTKQITHHSTPRQPEESLFSLQFT